MTDQAIEIDALGGNCPVQAQGKIDGEPFYFRARGQAWSLSIGSNDRMRGSMGVHGRDVIGNPKWYHREEWGEDEFSAGWMPYETAREMIEKGAALFRETPGGLTP